MIEILAIFFSSIAGLWDLKTTEVPDEIPYIMTAIGLCYWFFFSVSTGSMQPFFSSLIIGSVVLLVGIILYAKGKWGGADAWVLAAIFFMVPVYAGQFILTNYIINFFIVSLVYMAFYTVILGAKNHIFGKFYEELKKNVAVVLAVPAAYLAFSMAFIYTTRYFYSMTLLGVTFAFIVLMMLFWVYAKVIEKNLFIKKIKSSELKVGDVLAETNWVGVTEKDVLALRKTKRFITIKDGVRFVPVFPLTLAITLLYGNLLFMIF